VAERATRFLIRITGAAMPPKIQHLGRGAYGQE